MIEALATSQERSTPPSRRPLRWTVAHGRSLEFSDRGRLMGILNVTPDSFSDGGLFFPSVETAVEKALAMVADGASIIDIGGESTRPGAEPVDPATEQGRVLPVIAALVTALAGIGRDDILISVDTWRAETGRLAIAAGAHVLNDVWGLQRDPAMAALAGETGAGLCVMHTGRERRKNPDVLADQLEFLGRSLRIAAENGVASRQIVLDPGFGFAKDVAENVAIMARFGELRALGHPLMAGTSRKRFIGALTGRQGEARDTGTAATTALLRIAGACLFRVHDVASSRDALALADAMLAASSPDGYQET